MKNAKRRWGQGLSSETIKKMGTQIKRKRAVQNILSIPTPYMIENVNAKLDYRKFYENELGLELGAIKGDGYISSNVICPLHDDKNPSLSINLKSGYFNCFGCGKKGNVFEFYQQRHRVDDHICITELTKFIRFDGNNDNNTGQEGSGRFEANYDYLDQDKQIRMRVCRFDNKQFSQRSPDGDGGWVWNIRGVELIPYNIPGIIEADTVFIVEGEKDADNLNEIGLTASCNPMDAGKWKESYNQHFEGKIIIILPDNDNEGRKHAEQVANFLYKTAKSVKVVELPGLPEKGDVSDWLDTGNTKDQLLDLVQKAKFWTPESGWSSARKINYGIKIYTASELITAEFPEPKWAIPDILPEGLIILAGKPKVGKSILALNACIAVALGGKAFDYVDVEKGFVIYLALEDTPKRLQKRLKKMVPPGEAWHETDNLLISTHWPRMGEGGIIKLEEEIEKHPDMRFVVIDTLVKFRPPVKGRSGYHYDSDYKDVSQIKSLADEHGISILLIHHLRKTESDDVFDTFSGTFGLTGAADGLLALIRKKGKSELHVTGRDIENAEYALEFDGHKMCWNFLGKLEDVQSSKIKQQVYDILQGTDSILSPKELSELTGTDKHYVQKALIKLVVEGKIEREGRGKYKKKRV